jgi:hypothetical protein
MMSIPEQGARVATSAIDALKANPVILALVMLQIVVLTLLGWYSHERTKSNDRLIELFHTQFNTLVERCDGGTRGQGSGMKLQSDESRQYVLPPLDELRKQQ